MPKHVEEAFPRGGKPKKSWEPPVVSKPTTEKELFKQTLPEDPKPKKRKRKLSDSKQTKEEEPGSVEIDVQTWKLERLAKQTLSEDVLLLGCINKIHNYELIVSIPGGQQGRIPITNISKQYTGLLQELADEHETEKTADVSSLSDMFYIGQPVCCKVESVDTECKGCVLSINPSDVNDRLKPSTLKAGMIVPCAVASVEDHGYTMDIGIKGMTCFLHKKQAHPYTSKFWNGSELKVGMVLPCLINNQKGESSNEVSRNLKVSVDPDQVYKSQLDENSGVNIGNVLPGMIVKTRIEELKPREYRVALFSQTGLIPHIHTKIPSLNYKVGARIKACVLHVNPRNKAISLTTLPHLLTPVPDPISLFGDLKVGQIIEDAEIVDREAPRKIFLRLNEHVLACSFEIFFRGIEQDDNKYKIGSHHRCKILRFNFLENVAVVTLKQELIEEQVLRFGEINVGMKLKGTVKRLLDEGAEITLSSSMQGFVPFIHLADAIMKHPEKKYKEGATVKCRVLRMNPVRRKLILTCKKSLVSSKGDQITSYSQLSRGMIVEGFIQAIKNEGIVVGFYNSVQGFVPRAHWSTEKIEFPDRVFYVGQMVKAQVLVSFPADRKLLLSFLLKDKSSFGTKQIDLPENLKFGELTDCEILEKKKSGFSVKLGKADCDAFLPKLHLSDSITHTEMLYQAYQPGDVIPAVVFMGQSGNDLMVTSRKSFIEAAKEGTLISGFDQLQKDLVVPGVVKSFVDYGIFVEIAPGLSGLVPLKYLTDVKIPKTAVTSLFQTGQTVLTKVMEINTDKHNFLLSTKPSHCINEDNQQNGIDMLKYAIREEMHVRDMLKGNKGIQKKLAKLQMSDIVTVTVTDIVEHGVVCRLENGVQGFITARHLIGITCKTGDVLEALILYVDMAAQCVELSLLEDIIQSVKELHDTKYNRGKVGQSMKAEVHLIKEDFVLVSLKAQCRGRFAYIPTKRHYNDVVEKSNFEVGMQIAVVIKQLMGNLILAGLKMHETEKTKSHKSEVMQTHNLNLGDIISVRIKSVRKTFLNVHGSDLDLMVHVSEIEDNVKEKTNPVDKYRSSNNKVVNARVIGFREQHMKGCKPLTNQGLKTSIPVLSMKESILSLPLEELEKKIKDRPKVGESVTGFFTSHDKNCLLFMLSDNLKARVSIWNAHESPKVLQNIASSFREGCAYKGKVIKTISNNLVEIALIDETSVEKGKIVRGRITLVTPKRGLLIELPQGYSGSAYLTDLSDKYIDNPQHAFKRDQILECYVLKCDAKMREAVLSLRKSRLDGDDSHIEDPELPSLKRLKKGHICRGFIVNCDKNGVFVRLSHELVGRVLYEHASDYIIENPEYVFAPGTLVTAKIKSVIKTSGQVELSLLEKDTGTKFDIPEEYRKKLRHGREQEKEDTDNETKSDKAIKKEKKERSVKRKSDGKEMSVIKRKKKKMESDSGVESDDTDDEVQLLPPSALKKVPRLKVQGGFSWDEEFHLPAQDKEGSDSEGSENETQPQLSPGKVPRLAVSEKFSWDEKFRLSAQDKKNSDSEESDTEIEPPKAKMSKLSKKQKRLEEEKKLFLAEKQMLNTDYVPQTSEGFDKLVLQSPDSSMVWLRYMAFHLESMEVDKARSVAERALKTIAFREEQEKLNVWVAYLNLENMYGSSESQNKLFERALQHNEPVKVYNQLINIYESSDKIDKAEQLHNTLIRKYSQNKDMWANFGTFLYKHDKMEAARKLLQRSLKSLPLRNHVETIAKFAQLEFKFGESERGKTMYENILSSYPKRTDLWSVYIDMLIKIDEVDTARQVFERVIHLKLPAKKIKFFFKKYIDFEEKFGSHETMSEVKEKALEYVETKMDVDS